MGQSLTRVEKLNKRVAGKLRKGRKEEREKKGECVKEVKIVLFNRCASCPLLST